MAGAEIISASDTATVDALIVAIKSGWAKAEKLKRETCLAYLEVGRNLNRLKALSPHGSFKKIVIANFEAEHGLSYRTARLLMQLAQKFYGKVAAGCHFEMSQLQELLALPAGDEEIFLREMSAAGTPAEKMSKRQIRQAVKAWNNRHSEPVTVDVQAVIKATVAPVDAFSSPPSTNDAVKTLVKANTVLLPVPQQLSLFDLPPVIPNPGILIPECLREAAGETPIFYRRAPEKQGEPFIVVTRAATDSLRFHRLMATADAVCFAGKLKFPRSDGGFKSFPAVIFYFGFDVQKFLQNFRKFGACVQLKQKSSNVQHAEALL